MVPDVFGYPILCDFGSAFPDDQTWDGVAQVLPYRAPEIILGAEWDHKIDIWNFGVLVSSFLETWEFEVHVLMRSDLATPVETISFRQYRPSGFNKSNDQVPGRAAKKLS